jgi:hypothetical protein
VVVQQPNQQAEEIAYLQETVRASYAQNALWADFGNVSLSSGASSLRA